MSALFIAQPTPAGITFLEGFNNWRVGENLPPVKQHTLRRYLAGGKGYENGPPKKLMQYLRTIV